MSTFSLNTARNGTIAASKAATGGIRAIVQFPALPHCHRARNEGAVGPMPSSYSGRTFMKGGSAENCKRPAGISAFSDATALGVALTDDEAYSDAVSTWDELKSMASLCYAVAAGSNDVESICRVMAAEELGPQTTLEILQPAGAVQFYQKFLDGTLFNCATVIDTHYRLLKDCLIQDNYDLVKDMYSNLLSQADLDRSLVEAGALVGAQALEYLKEEPEIIVSMLSEMMEGPDFVEEEMRRDYMRAKALIDGVDKLLEELPVANDN